MKRWQFWLGLLLTLVFLGLTVANIDLVDTRDALARANLWWLIPGVGFSLLGLWLRSWRWAILLRPVAHVSIFDSFRIVIIGQMGNNIFPARLGEVLRAYLLRSKANVPVASTLATIAVAGVLDGLVMLGFVFFNLPLLSGSGAAGNATFDNVLSLVRSGAALFLGMLLVLLLMQVLNNHLKQSIWAGVDRVLPDRVTDILRHNIERLMTGLASLRSPADFAAVLGLTVLGWLAETGKFWFVMQGFDFVASFRALMLTNGTATLATAIPSAPGFIGTYHAAATSALRGTGVADAAAVLAFITVIHFSMMLTVVLPGLLFFFQEGLTFAAVREMGETEAKAN